MLGSCVTRCLESLGLDFSKTSIHDVDVADRDAVRRLLASERHTHIINCAAYTNVDAAESDSDTAFAVNETGVQNLAELAAAAGATLVHVSTDYVFSGKNKEPYTESAACEPLGIYGASKLAGERALVQAIGSFEASPIPAFIVRTSWLFGPGGKNFVRTMFQLLQDKEELRVVSDQFGRPSHAMDVARALLEISGLSGAATWPNGLYHFANAGVTTWFGLAQLVREELAKRLPEIPLASLVSATTAEYPTTAARPLYSVLSTDRFESAANAAPRPWQDSVTEYVDYLCSGGDTKHRTILAPASPSP